MKRQLSIIDYNYCKGFRLCELILKDPHKLMYFAGQNILLNAQS